MTRSLRLVAVLCLSAAVHAQALPVRWVPSSASLVEPVLLSTDVLFRTPSGALVAGSAAGMYRSTADGPWTRVTHDSLRAVRAVAWTAAGSSFYVAAGTFGVLASADDGQTWHTSGLAGASVTGLAAFPDGALVAAGTYGQVYRRDAAAADWIAVGHPGPACYSYGGELKALAGGILLLTCDRDLYRSADRGTTWTITGQRSSGGVAVTPGGAVFLVRADRSVARSLDSGATWEVVGQAITRTSSGRLEAGADGFLYHAVTAQGETGVARSSDGESWAWVARAPGYYPPSAVLPPDGASPSLYVSDVQNGTLRVDLVTGAAVGLNAGAFQEVPADAMSSAGPWTALTSGRAIYRTRDRGASWTPVPLPSGVEYVTALLVLDDGVILAGSSRVVSRTSDGGLTWTTVSLWGASTFGGSSITTLIRTRLGALLAGTSSSNGMSAWGDLFRSDDGGQTWTRTTADSQRLFGPISVIAEGEGSTVFAGQRWGGFEGAGGALRRSDDDGRTWTVVREDPVDAIAPVGDGQLLLVTSDFGSRLVRASSSGAEWALLGPAPGRPVSLFRAADAAVYLHSYSGGIRRTADGGDTWQAVADGLEDRRVWVMTQDANGYLYAGTPTGVFRSAQAAVAGAPAPEPVATALERPRPNPARARATLAFTLADAGDVDLGLYDLLGRRIATLAQGTFGMGRHEASWAASDLPPGSYLAVLRAPGVVATQAVTVAR